MEGSTLLREGTLARRDAAMFRAPRQRGWREVLFARLRRHRGLLAVVIAPTLLVGVYVFAIAADQYESEAHFIIKSAAQPNASSGSGLAQMFGLAGSALTSQSDSYSVGDYLSSHDAVDALQTRLGLVAMFRRPEADPIARLGPGAPSAETLLKFYRRQVKVAFSTETGITTLKVHAFRPQDARAIAETLLELGEQRVNALNQRVLQNGLALAKDQLRQAETAVVATEGGLTRFRQTKRDIDPDRASTAQIGLLASLQQQLAQSRAQLAAMSSAVQKDSPEYIALEQKVNGLSAQVSAQAGRLTGAAGAIAPDLDAYEGLKLRQDFSSKRYESAAAAMEAAREQAIRQELYVVRVVEPNLPEKALYPRRWATLAMVFFGSLLIYGIGWLILAGVREHAA